MKKFIFSFLILMFSVSFSQEINLDEMKMDRMPTDDEIRQEINKYNFNKSQKEVLFKDTKRKLEMIYEAQNKETPKTKKK